jgi:hypothetical protein
MEDDGDAIALGTTAFELVRRVACVHEPVHFVLYQPRQQIVRKPMVMYLFI